VEDYDMGGVCSTNGGEENACKLLVEKPEGNRYLHGRRIDINNIKMDLVEIRWGDVDWMGLVQDKGKWRALVNAVMKLRVP
jgi:hypothetical protein